MMLELGNCYRLVRRQHNLDTSIEVVELGESFRSQTALLQSGNDLRGLYARYATSLELPQPHVW